MDGQLWAIVVLTFIIHLIGTLAYSVRIAGTRTGRIAVSFALFNLLVLVSRTSNSFQTPLIAKRVEEDLAIGRFPGAIDFRLILLAAALATLVGGLLIPTFQRVFTAAVARFAEYRSFSRLLLHGFSKGGLRHLRDSVTLPSAQTLKGNHSRRPPIGIAAANAFAVAIWTVGVFAALYAGYLAPELRATASNLSAVVNGVATILLFLVIDPHLSVLTDEVVEGAAPEGALRQAVVWMVGSRMAGTLLAQLLLVPAAALIVWVARVL